jgi:hypothetical protein
MRMAAAWSQDSQGGAWHGVLLRCGGVGTVLIAGEGCHSRQGVEAFIGEDGQANMAIELSGSELKGNR